MGITSYLQRYLDSISTMPSDVKDKLTEMESLDKECGMRMRAVEQEMLGESKVNKSGHTNEEQEGVEESLLTKIEQVQRSGLRKIALAEQIYNIIDRHVQRLDVELNELHSQYCDGQVVADKSKKKGAVSRADTTDRRGQDSKSSNNVRKRNKSFSYSKHKKGDKYNNDDDDDFSAIAAGDVTMLNMPIDPNEPLYCFCRDVSRDTMIMCDDNKCKYEWFHLTCLQMTEVPKGKWYCPMCIKKRKRRKR